MYIYEHMRAVLLSNTNMSRSMTYIHDLLVAVLGYERLWQVAQVLLEKRRDGGDVVLVARQRRSLAAVEAFLQLANQRRTAWKSGGTRN